MAVPKQRQSSTRTRTRRANHKMAKPTIAVCTRCGAPRIPHRVCGECGTYGGREIVVKAAPEIDDE